MYVDTLYLPDIDIVFTSCNSRKNVHEDYMPEHILCHVFSGEICINEGQRQTVYPAGNSLLLKRNALLKCEKRPDAAGNAFHVIFLLLRKDFLQEYALQNAISTVSNPSGMYLQVKNCKNTGPLQGLFNSLTPYWRTGTTPSPAMTKLKLTEAVICLLEQDPSLTGWLFHVAEPGKLDLEAFIQRNYMFNVPMSKFAELSGRSLSTFQRDFQKIFGMSASAWLLNRRLEAAHEALLNPAVKPKTVYMEVGFEDLRPFSRPFKEKYGYSPSQVKNPC